MIGTFSKKKKKKKSRTKTFSVHENRQKVRNFSLLDMIGTFSQKNSLNMQKACAKLLLLLIICNYASSCLEKRDINIRNSKWWLKP